MQCLSAIILDATVWACHPDKAALITSPQMFDRMRLFSGKSLSSLAFERERSILSVSDWQVFGGSVILANNKLTAIDRLQATE